MKKKILLVAGVLLLALFSTLIIGYINFKNSPKALVYKMYIALKEQDTTVVNSIYDFDSIADDLHGQFMTEYAKEVADNPFAGLGYAMAANMKPTIKQQITTTIQDVYKNGVPEYKKVSNFVIWYKTYTKKSMINNETIEYTKRNKKQYDVKMPDQANGYINYEFTKKDDGWVITKMNVLNNN